MSDDIQAGGPGFSFEESVAAYPESAAKALREMAAQLVDALRERATLRVRIAKLEAVVEAADGMRGLWNPPCATENPRVMAYDAAKAEMEKVAK